METSPVRLSFTRELRGALNDLYDPATLRNSPLARLFGVDGREDTPSALRRVLTNAIEALKPDSDVPPGASARRIYQVLHYRYAEQCTQREVATDLALSIRQLRRQEKLAVQVLANYLWSRYSLERETHLLDTSSQGDDEASPANAGAPSREQELQWLKKVSENSFSLIPAATYWT